MAGREQPPTPRGLLIEVEPVGPAGVCSLYRLSGCLDAGTAPALSARIDNCARRGGIRLIFDLTRVFYLSSTGIDCFANALKAVKPRGGDLVLVGLQERVRGVLRMYGFERAFQLGSSVADAVTLLSPSGSKCGSIMTADAAGSVSIERRAKAGEDAALGGPVLLPVQVFGSWSWSSTSNAAARTTRIAFPSATPAASWASRARTRGCLAFYVGTSNGYCGCGSTTCMKRGISGNGNSQSGYPGGRTSSRPSGSFEKRGVRPAGTRSTAGRASRDRPASHSVFSS